MVYSDKELFSAPDMRISHWAYYHVFPSLFRTAELADFFSSYRSAYTEDGKLALWEEYFGTAGLSLSSEEVTVNQPWGRIAMTGDTGVYHVTLQMADGGNDEYMVYPSGAGIRVQAMDGDRTVYEAEMSVADGLVYVDKMKSVMVDEDGTEVLIEVLEKLSVPRCANGEYVTRTRCGAAGFLIRGEIDDKFIVRYNESGYTVER